MRSKLRLKGNKLMAFALVYGFCQDGNNSFEASLSFVRKWLGVSQPTAVSVMAELTEAKYLTKKDNGPCNPFTYNVNFEKVNQLKNLTGKESEPVKKLNTHQLKNLTPTSKETLLNIYTDNNTDSNNTHTKQNSPNPKQQNETQREARRPGSDEVDFVQVAKEMADYFENDEQGKAQWAFMCETKKIKVSPIAITSQWAAKHCDSPYMLNNWRKQTGKIINWIQKPSQKSKSGFRTQGNNTEYTPPKNVKRAAAPKKKATPADIEEITRNAKYL